MLIESSPTGRITVQIPSASGDLIEAWVYLPEGGGPHPAVVMAHGIGGIKAGGLDFPLSPSASARRASPTCCEPRSTSSTATPRPQHKSCPEGSRGLAERSSTNSADN